MMLPLPTPTADKQFIFHMKMRRVKLLNARQTTLLFILMILKWNPQTLCITATCQLQPHLIPLPAFHIMTEEKQAPEAIFIKPAQIPLPRLL